MPFLLLYITNPSQAVAKKVALHLLKKRLGACANIFPVHSAYLWRGRIEKTREWILIFKTISRNYKAVEKEIKKIHPYKVPCIMKISASANRDYEKWLRKEIKLS